MDGTSSIKFSFVVPIFNGENHLERCLDSILSQTLKDIEIICVDDASTDKTFEILSSYCKKDKRVKVLTNDVNKSSHVARKRGVLNARGEYIWFVDADDEVNSDSCEELYSRLHKFPVDILHFNAEIMNDGDLPQKRIDFMKGFVMPFNGKLHGIAVFKECFEHKIYQFNLWNKVFETNLCKKAFSKMKDQPLPKGQDKYEYFVISYYAMSYQGMPDKTYYTYHFGAGVTGHNYLSPEVFERYCTMAKVSEAIRDFLLEERTDKKYDSIFEQVKNDLFQDCFNNWLRNVSGESKGQCFDQMVKYWGSTYVVSKVADKYWFNQGYFSKMISKSKFISSEGRKVKTIATFYHSLANGGVQRVLSGLMYIWIQMGYNVVLITDTKPTEEDYSIPDEVKRITIPAPPKINRKNFIERAEALRQALIENSVDVMVYHAWVSNILLWDLLICKLSNVCFISHCHNVFSMLMINAREYFASLPRMYHLCDGIVTLSEVDRNFWLNFNRCVFEVQNPLSFNPQEVGTSDLDSNTILWLGRLSEEKRPLDAVKIMERVVEAIPNAKMVMVGSGDTSLTRKRDMMIKKLNLSNNIETYSYTKEVIPFYRLSSIFLSTSRYEGYPTTFTESGAAGLPCVSYQLPYLTLSRKSEGIIQVPQGDSDAAALEIINLLEDTELRRKTGNAAQEYILNCTHYNYTNTWKNIFDAMEKTQTQMALDDTSGIMWDTLIEHYRLGATKNNREIAELSKKVGDLNYGKIETKNSSKYTVTIRKGFKSLKDNGLSETFRLISDKFKSYIRRIK